jgi:phospholipid/cholesterol/gamma-HCH transport system substrate-binding protein
MENRANYALIGLFVLFALTAVAAFSYWLLGKRWNQIYDNYEIAFDGGVRGLSQGSEVRFNGLAIGEVTNLRYDREDTNIVLAQIQVSENTPIDTQASAKLTPLGLTGLNYIEITPGGQDFPLLADLPGRGIKRIVGQGSEIDELLGGGGDVLVSAQSALARLNVVLSPENTESLTGILNNIENITGAVDVSNLDADKLNDMLDSFSAAADAIRATADSIAGTSGTIDTVVAEDLRGLLEKADATLASIETTVGTFEGTAGNVDSLIVDSRDAVNRLSNSGLADMEETVDAIRRLVSTLARVADSLEQSPAQFIAGAEREEVVLPQ